MNKIKEEILSSAVSSMVVKERGAATKRFLFSNDFIGFSGHFPGYPVLPAFVQIMTACTLSEEFMGRTLKLASIEKAKFLIEIKPDQEVMVQIKGHMLGEMPGFEASIILNNELAASFRMSFEGDEEGIS